MSKSKSTKTSKTNKQSTVTVIMGIGGMIGHPLTEAEMRNHGCMCLEKRDPAMEAFEADIDTSNAIGIDYSDEG